MRLINFLFLLFFLFSLFACEYYKKEIVGVYNLENLKLSHDTIILKENNIYDRMVYDLNGVQLLKYSSKWKFQKPNRIILTDFYLNLDDDLNKFPELLKDRDMEINTFIETIDGRNGFNVGYYENQFNYLKVR